MSAIQSVLIVGAGIGGLSAAIALRKRNIPVDVVEIQAQLHIYGVGIIQQSNVVREMARLGLLQKYLSRAYAFDEVGQYTADGRLMRKLASPRLAGPEYPANVGISRLELHRVLTDAARALDAQIRFGITVDALTQDSDSVRVRFTDGSERRYALVVGADGVHSKIRAMLFPSAPRPMLTGQSVWRHCFARDAEVDHLSSYVGPDGNAGLCPLANDLMYMYLTSREPGNPRMEGDELVRRFRERLVPFGGLIGRLKAQIVDAREIVYRPLQALLMPSPWYRGRVLLIGDAAHTTTPHLGQGAGMAIEDAVVLAELLEEVASVPEALERFMARRFERCRYIVERSVLMGQWEMENKSEQERAGLVMDMMQFTAAPI